MPAILLVRHGQGSFGTADYDVLSERGEEQSRVVHAALEAHHGRARLVSGSLKRQVGTAKPWTDTGEGLRIDARWNEYDSADVFAAHGNPEYAGALEHRPGEEQPQMDSRQFQFLLDEALHSWIAAGHDGAGGGESYGAFRDRVLAALNDLAGELDSGETGIAFTSGGVIALIATAVLEVPAEHLVTFNHVAVNGAITKLVAGRRGVTLISFNEHAHLEPGGLVTYR